MKTKPVKVNLSTKAPEVLATMREEMPKAQYFFRKAHGGRLKYEALEQQMLDDALEQEKDQFTDIDYYISPVGNRWMSYTHVVYYPRAKYALATRYSFIYYETYASCGAFFPIYSDTPKYSRSGKEKKAEKILGVILYTDHFFYRLSTHLKVEYRSKELIRKFIAERCEHAMTTADDGECIQKFQGGHGFGKEVSREPRMIQIRTFLTDSELTKSQKRRCEAVDALYYLYRDGTHNKDVALATAINSDYTIEEMAEMAEKNLKAAKTLGMGALMVFNASISAMFAMMLSDLLHVELDAKQTMYASYLTQETRDAFIRKYAKSMTDVKYDAAFRSDLIDCLLACAKVMNLCSITRPRVAAWVDEYYDKASQNDSHAS